MQDKNFSMRVTFTPEELEQVSQIASKYGLKNSHYVKMTTMKQLNKEELD
jgi:hypothetical protein